MLAVMSPAYVPPPAPFLVSGGEFRHIFQLLRAIHLLMASITVTAFQKPSIFLSSPFVGTAPSVSALPLRHRPLARFPYPFVFCLAGSTFLQFDVVRLRAELEYYRWRQHTTSER